MESIIQLTNQVYNLSPDNRKKILEWLARAYYHNDELINDHVYDELYIMLSSKYKPLTEDAVTLELLRNIRDGIKEANEDNMSLITLEHIMIGLKGGLGLDTQHGVEKKLFDYHIKYNKEFIYNLYMEELNNYIGKEVIVVGKHEKEPIFETGILNDVDNYKSINVDGQNISFVDFQHYICTIRDEDNKLLYFDNTDYKMNRLLDSTDISIAQSELFGKNNTIQRNKVHF